MNKKKIIFKSSNIFDSLKGIFFADKEFILILFILSCIFSALLSNYFETKKTFSLEITHSYNETIILTGLKMISSKSFNMYAYQENYFDEILPRNSVDFPSFRFRIFDKKDIEVYEKRVEYVLSSYKSFLVNKLQNKIEFLDEINQDDEENNINELKYTLYALKNSPIFYDKKIAISEPDNFFVTFLKINLLVLLIFLFLRFLSLIFKKKIIIK